MMKPEFSKPFNLKHARAGAPFGSRDGRVATILKWDGRRPGEPLIGYQGEDDIPASWAVDGAYSPEHETDLDLLMLPLGLIDGKPVFVGDELHDRWGNTVHAYVGMGFDPLHWVWPAPPRVYPETQLSFEALCVSGDMPLTSTNSIGIRALANAVLRHAIDAGQVVTKVESDDAVRKAYQDGQSAAFKHEADSRAARDMAVAVAVRNVAQSARPMARGYDLSEDASELSARIAQLDLAVIIAAIK